MRTPRQLLPVWIAMYKAHVIASRYHTKRRMGPHRLCRRAESGIHLPHALETSMQ